MKALWKSDGVWKSLWKVLKQLWFTGPDGWSMCDVSSSQRKYLCLNSDSRLPSAFHLRSDITHRPICLRSIRTITRRDSVRRYRWTVSYVISSCKDNFVLLMEIIFCRKRFCPVFCRLSIKMENGKNMNKSPPLFVSWLFKHTSFHHVICCVYINVVVILSYRTKPIEGGHSDNLNATVNIYVLVTSATPFIAFVHRTALVKTHMAKNSYTTEVRSKHLREDQGAWVWFLWNTW